MIRAKLTTRTLYSYDSTIFDNIKLPEGIEADMVINKILFEYGDIALYNDNPGYVKAMIPVWSASNLDNWERIKKALDADYDPIENYDRREDWTDTGKGTTESNVSAYNESDYAPDGQATSNTSTTHSARIHGNIGVTTNPQMIKEEYDLRTHYCVYDAIAESYFNYFLLKVY